MVNSPLKAGPIRADCTRDRDRQWRHLEMARILVAEDDGDIRQILKHLLDAAGHDVVLANDGDAAREILLSDPPDVLVLDVMMPHKDGYEVLREMDAAGLRGRTKVLVLTAKTSERDWEMSLELGADCHMPKPFDTEELLDKVEELLAASEDELQTRREQERDRAHLLSQLESIFGDNSSS